MLQFTGDVSVEFGGANLYGAVVWNDVKADVPGASSINPWGFLVQGGFYVANDWELFGRFEWSDYDLSPLSVDDLSLLTVGVNKYFAGHNAKWTTDFGYGFNAVFTPADITGWRNDFTNDNNGQIVVRTQWQLLF